MKIGVNKIELGIPVRDATDEEIIQRYMEILDQLPPIVVFRTKDKYLLADGFHRWAAAIKKNRKYIEAEVKEGTLEEAFEFAITANLRHGKPLMPREYENALRRLIYLHPNWSQRKLGKILNRSRTWVGSVLAANDVSRVLPNNNLNTAVKTEIAKAPKELWIDLADAAQKEKWSRDEVRRKVKKIKAEPGNAEEIVKSVSAKLPEVPADKLVPLDREIKKLGKMQDSLSNKLEPNLYDWGSGLLAIHILHSFYGLAEKTLQLADGIQQMIEFLESYEK